MCNEHLPEALGRELAASTACRADADLGPSACVTDRAPSSSELPRPQRDPGVRVRRERLDETMMDVSSPSRCATHIAKRSNSRRRSGAPPKWALSGRATSRAG